jgi:hypothetical protein
MDTFGELEKRGEVGGLPFEFENLSESYKVLVYCQKYLRG